MGYTEIRFDVHPSIIITVRIQHKVMHVGGYSYLVAMRQYETAGYNMPYFCAIASSYMLWVTFYGVLQQEISLDEH